MSETKYALRRSDGELIGDYAFIITEGPDDWYQAELDSEFCDATIIYEMVKMEMEVVGTKELPNCGVCNEVAGRYWGLCEDHAREDDEETLNEILAARESDGDA